MLWWGRPDRLAIAGRNDLAVLPVMAIVAATVAAAVFAPRDWHPVVATIFRLAFAASAVSLIATYLTIVVRQRRQRCYAITRDRVLLIGDFWAAAVAPFRSRRCATRSWTRPPRATARSR